MTEPGPLLDLLQGIDRKLNALLALYTHRVLLQDDSLAKPRPRSIDRMLADAGLKGVEIASILGKSQQSVSEMLAKDKRVGSPKKKAAASDKREGTS
jgi:hypothetical protein